jgi:hypothetical protein
MQDPDELGHSRGFLVHMSVTFNENDLMRYHLRLCQSGSGVAISQIIKVWGSNLLI